MRPFFQISMSHAYLGHTYTKIMIHFYLKFKFSRVSCILSDTCPPGAAGSRPLREFSKSDKNWNTGHPSPWPDSNPPFSDLCTHLTFPQQDPYFSPSTHSLPHLQAFAHTIPAAWITVLLC